MSDKTDKLLRLDLQHFGGGEDPKDPKDPDNLTDPKEEPKEPEKTFTQAELNEKIAARIAREKAKYKDYDDIKTQLTEFEKAEEERKKAEMTEVERLQAELDAKIEAEEALANQLEETRNQVKQQVINSEFTKLANENNIAYIDAAFRLVDLSDVKVDDEGKVTGADEAVAALIKDNPFLVEAEKKKPKQIGGGTNKQNNNSGKTDEQIIAEAEDVARKTGRIEDRAKVAQLKRELGRY